MACVFAGAFSCANPTGPNGGKRDTAGPEIIGTIPEPGTLNFNYKEIVFYFDEFLKPGNYKDEIFISPVPAEDPEITVKNKRLTIKFLEPLRENTTYVISLGTGIKDFNEGNKLEKSFIYAFSTGAILDSLKFSGKVSDMWSGAPEKDMKIMLFRSNEVEGNDITGVRPEYVCVTDKKGYFDFQYLAGGSYKLYGIVDKDNDFMYGGRGERIALAKTPLIVLPSQDSIRTRIEMVAFTEDKDGVSVKSAKWSNEHTVHLEFSERIRPTYGRDSLKIEIMDTLGGGLENVEMTTYRYKNKQHLYFHSPKPKNKDYDIRITNLMDSLGQKGDTIIRLRELAMDRAERDKLFEKPINMPKGSDLFVPALMIMPKELDSSNVQLLDTNDRQIITSLRPLNFGFRVRPKVNLDPEITYTLQIKKSFPKPDGKPTDSLYQFKVRFPDPDEFGTISGKVLPDSTRPDARFVVIFRGKPGTAQLVNSSKSGGDKKSSGRGGKSGGVEEGVINYYEQRFAGPTTFKFVYLHPGKYTVDIIDDADGNGILSPGSLIPYQMPEKVYHQSSPIDIRAKWDMEDVEIYPIPDASKGKGKRSGGKKGNDDEDEDGDDEDFDHDQEHDEFDLDEDGGREDEDRK